MKPFKRIFRYPISIWGPKTYSNLCDDQALFAMQKLWAMIAWEYSSFVRDCKRIGTLDDWMENHSKWNRFYTRNVARTTSYINLVCALEDIIKKCFDDTLERGNAWFPTPFKIKSSQRKNIEEDKTLKVIRDYRNKLTAHTAYGKPFKKDKKENISTRITSLLYVQSGGFCGNDPLSFHFGGSQIVVGNKDPHYFRERFGMRTHHKAVMKHFLEWEDLFREMLQHFQKQCPIKKKGYRFISHPDQLKLLK